MNLYFKRRLLVIPAVLALGFCFYQANYETPILMYHRVGSDSGEAPSTIVSTRTFQRQMEFLKIHNYNVISLLDYADLLRSGRKIPFNTIVVTFDDGTLDNFKNAFPVLKKMHFKATIFMITGNIGKESWLSEEDLKILEAAGILIGSHTVHHAFLPKLSFEQMLFELQESRNRLEKILGHPVFLFSYPAGGVTEVSKHLAKNSGYQCAVTTNYGTSKSDVMALHRIKIGESSGSLVTFWIKTSGLYHLGKKRIEVK